MKKLPIFRVLALAGIGLRAHAASAQGSGWSLETDPSTFAFKGYAGHLRYSPPKLSGWTVSAGTYALTFPKAMLNLPLGPRGFRAELRLKRGYGVFLDRNLSRGPGGWFAGVQTAYQEFNLRSLDTDGEAGYHSILVMPRLGYRFELKGSNAYILPWAGLGYLMPSSDLPSVGGQATRVHRLLPFAAIHAGFRF